MLTVFKLVRSPSVYFNEKIDKNGRENYDATIIPNRGAWLEYETDAKDVVYVRIDRTRTTINSIVMRIEVLVDQEIVDLLGDNEYLRNTLETDQKKH